MPLKKTSLKNGHGVIVGVTFKGGEGDDIHVKSDMVYDMRG